MSQSSVHTGTLYPSVFRADARDRARARPGRPHVRPGFSLEALALPMIRDGVPAPAIARLLGVGEARVERWAMAAGVPLPGGDAPRHPLQDEGVSLAVGGIAPALVSAQLGVSPYTVLHWAMSAGVALPGRSIEVLRDRARSLHAQGAPVVAIAHNLLLPRGTVRAWLAENAPRPARRPHHPQWAQGLSLLESGLPAGEVAAATGAHPVTVSRWAKGASVPRVRRSPSEAHRDEALAMLRQGAIAGVIEQRLGVARHQVYRWAREGGLALRAGRPRGTLKKVPSPRVWAILGALAGGESEMDVAQMFGVSRAAIYSIRKRWVWSEGDGGEG